jgi:nucleoid DNA-binding protein
MGEYKNYDHLKPKKKGRGRKAENKTNDYYLTDADLYRAIKSSGKIRNYITAQDIKDIFEVYGEIVEVSILNDIKVPLPFVGTFKQATHGRTKAHIGKCRDMITGETYEVYIGERPSYKKLAFDADKKVKERIKRKTVEDMEIEPTRRVDGKSFNEARDEYIEKHKEQFMSEDE